MMRLRLTRMEYVVDLAALALIAVRSDLVHNIIK